VKNMISDYTEALGVAKLCARRLAKQYNLPIDDVISEAYFAVAQKIEKFDPEKAALGTYITMVVTRQVCTYLRYKQAAFRKAVKNNFDDFDVAETVKECLDSDIQEVVAIAMVFSEHGHRSKSIKRKVEKELVDRGWGRNRIAEAFESISESLESGKRLCVAGESN